MFKKKTVLNVRPEPPSFAEITEDINSAESNDIIFAQYSSVESLKVNEYNGADPSVSVQQPGPALSVTSSSSTVSRSPTLSSESAEQDTNVDAVYCQATEFISFTEQLKQELSSEQSQQERLRAACVQVTERLESMRQTVHELRARAAAN